MYFTGKSCQLFTFECLPVVQQFPPDQVVSKFLQLFVPHTKSPSQSESLSQFPSPKEHLFEDVQQSESSVAALQTVSKRSQKQKKKQ